MLSLLVLLTVTVNFMFLVQEKFGQRTYGIFRDSGFREIDPEMLTQLSTPCKAINIIPGIDN